MITIEDIRNHSSEPCTLTICPRNSFQRHEYTIAPHDTIVLALDLREVPYFELEGDAAVTIQISRNGKYAQLQFGPNSETKAMLVWGA